MKKSEKKKKHTIWKWGSIFLVLCIAVAGLCFSLGDKSDAAEGLYLTCDGYQLNAQTAYQMKNRQATLILGSEDSPIYADPNLYEIKWSIETGKDIADIQQGSSQIYGIVTAKNPGEVTVLATVYNKVASGLGPVIGSVTCKIQVVFAVDTSQNDNVFKKPYEDSQDKAIFLRTTDKSVPLTLNYGKSSEAQWTVANSEVAEVSATGVVTPKGAGMTKITATYTPKDSPEITYSTTIDVYVYPSISETDSNYGNLKTIKMDTGGTIYTDANFMNNIEGIKNKMDWVIKRDSGGTEEVIADSLTKKSDLIEISPESSRSNQLRVTAKAGLYRVYFYPHGAYESEQKYIDEDVYAPTVLNLYVYASPNDYKETIAIGDTYDIAKAFNLSTEEFLKYFEVQPKDFKNYASYKDGVITALDKNSQVTTKVNAEVTVRPEYESYIRSLLPDNSTVMDKGYFNIEITIADVFKLNQNYITVYKGSETNLSAYFNDTQVLEVEWSSSDPDYATVDETGKVTAKKVTTDDVVITAVYRNGAGSPTAKCMVRIVDTPNKFDIDPANAKLNVGESIVVKIKGNPDVSQVPTSWWSYDNRYVNVEFDNNGKTATITAKAPTGDGSTTEVVFNNPNTDEKDDPRCKITIVVPYETIKLTEENLTMKVGATHQLKYTYTPNNVTDKTPEWTSLDTNVVTVDENGYLTAVNPGTTIVMLSPKYNPNKVYAQCTVTVVSKCEEITLTPNELTLNVGDTQYVDVALAPEGCNSELTIEVGDENILDYEYKPNNRIINITGKKAGVTTINVGADDATRKSIKVTVLQPCNDLAFSPNAYEMIAGETYTPNLVKTPDDSTDAITWVSYNPDIADVDEKGVITAKKTGVTFIQATSASGRVAVIQITVKETLTAVTLKPEKATIEVGESMTLTPDFLPAAAYDKSMEWSVADPSIAKLENQGESSVKVTGLKGGITLIKGVAKSGGFVVSCLLTVTEKSTSVEVNPTSKFLQKGKRFTIKATVTSATATNKSVKWKSSKKSVASVTSKGVVKGKKIGTAYITATAKDGSGAFARCKVRVVRKVTKITLNKYTAKLLVGKTLKLKAKVHPKKATIKSVAWSSSDNSIATVDASGRVQGLAAGMVKIRAKAKDGSGKSAVCLITVSDPIPATGVDVTNNDLIVAKGRQIQSGITIAPSNSTDKIKYYSDNPAVARINKRGKIYANRVGQATVYGETSNGQVGYADVLVVTLNRRSLPLRLYDTETLRVNEISTGVTWHSQNPLIASVDSTGKVVGRRRGVTRIYATVRGLKLSCKVTVSDING